MKKKKQNKTKPQNNSSHSPQITTLLYFNLQISDNSRVKRQLSKSASFSWQQH